MGSMKPKSVTDGAADADKYLDDLKKGQPGETAVATEPAAAEPTPAAAPVAAAPPTPATPATPVAVDPLGTPATASVADASLKAELDRTNQALRVLQGKYDTEVVQVHAVNREMKQEIENLKTSIATLSNQAPQSPGNGNQVKTSSSVQEKIDKLSKEYDSDFAQIIVDIASDIARNTMEQSFAPLVKEVGTVREDTMKSKKKAYLDELTAAHSDWKQVVMLPEFAKFLDTVDPLFGGETRREVAARAQEACNSSQVIAFYTLFKNSHPDAMKRIATSTQHNKPILTPSASGGAITDEEKPIYSRTDIEAFYAAKNKGIWRGTQEEWDQLNALYTQAAIEGRISG